MMKPKGARVVDSETNRGVTDGIESAMRNPINQATRVSSLPSTPNQRAWHETSSGERVRIDPVARPRRWGELPGHLTGREWLRRLCHMAPGLLPVASYIYPHQDPLSPTFLKIAAGLIVGYTAWLLFRYQKIRRTDERTEVSAVVGYSTSVLATLLLFPKHAELGMLVLCVLAFGDGMATMCGMLFRGPRLPWNREKSWAGMLAFIGFGGYLASLAYWAESQPQASWPIGLTCGFAAAVVAAFAESLPSRMNDNVRVGIASAVTAVTTHAMVVGL